MLRLILIVCFGASLCAALFPGETQPLRCLKRNEISKCVTDCPPENSCLNMDVIVHCPPPTMPCENKCVCQDGFFRNAAGNCVLRQYCDLACKRRYEVKKCVNKCPPEKTCRNKHIQYNCAQPLEPCQYKCVCQDGYFRNVVGDCILAQNCDRCLGNHEYFACAGYCDNVCSVLDRQNKTNCPFPTFICNERCYCEDGYARDPRNICVPIEYCQEAALCDNNEMFTECKTTCPPETCLSIVAFYDCSSMSPCRPRCTCKDGFLRYNTTSRCIPQHTCPPMMY